MRPLLIAIAVTAFTPSQTGPAHAAPKKKKAVECTPSRAPATESVSCSSELGLFKDVQRVAKALDDEAKKDPTAELKAIAERDKTVFDSSKKKGYTPKQLLVKPTRETCGSVTYDFSPEGVLEPGEAFYFHVPERFRERSVIAALLAHRQDPSYGNNPSVGSGGWDDKSGNTAIQMHDKTLPDSKSWRGYQAPWGESAVPERSGQGSKFAELRHSAEKETLEGFRSHGHKGSIEGDVSRAPIYADAFRMLSTGREQVLINGGTVKFDPVQREGAGAVDKTNVETKEFIFNAGLKFENYATGAEAEKPGGFDPGGNYGGAVKLGSGSSASKKLPDGVTMQSDGLHIKIPAGYKVAAVDVVAGDLHEDGSSGGARLSMDYKRASGTTMPYMKGENVGKHDTMIGYAESDCDYVSQEGDEFVISASGDVAHLSGVRLTLVKK